jgi:hypothetical protein
MPLDRVSVSALEGTADPLWFLMVVIVVPKQQLRLQADDKTRE